MAARALAVVALLGLTGCRCGPTSPVAGARLVVRLEPFDSALRGQAVDRPLRFLNPGASPVRVSALEVRGAEAFALLGPNALDVPAGGQQTVVVRFSPAQLGAHAGTLHFLRGDTGQPDVVRLDALAVGPAVQLDPSLVDLGTHELYGGRKVSASAVLTLRNLGLDTEPPRADAALRLAFEVPGNAAGELCVGDCRGGELVLPAGALAQVPVTFTGHTAGVRQWDVRVRSNDPLAPVRTVRVQVAVVARPTCQFQLSPNGLAFGALRPPASLERELELENVGSEPCDVTSIELAPEFPQRSAPVFSLVEPPGPQALPPGGRLRLTVRASDASRPPPSPAPVEGALVIHLNHPDGPARAPLSVVLQQLCLVLDPSPLDLGVVQLGCHSEAKVVRAWNVCTVPLTVTSAPAPAGRVRRVDRAFLADGGGVPPRRGRGGLARRAGAAPDLDPAAG